MAYNKSGRFQYAHKRFRIFDPGAYQYPYTPLIDPNKVQFLSNAPRKTTVNKIWTHTIHFPKKQEKIQNCTSFQSKVPRFSYEVEKPKAAAEVLCNCGSDVDLYSYSEKPDEKIEKKEQVICQGKVQRRLFIGPVKNHSVTRVAKSSIDVPFYDTRVQALTSFYQGCQWSRWTSRRDVKIPEQGPGPADYNFERPSHLSKICAENFRAKRRKTSRQLRFIEIVQRKTIRDNHPSPASYNPIFPKRNDFRISSSKKEPPKTNSDDHLKDSPGPADYHIPRDFEVETRNLIKCLAKLPRPAPFGIKDLRFKQFINESPGPASYCINNLNLFQNHINWDQCYGAPFGSTSKRFKETLVYDDLSGDSDEPEQSKNPKCISKLHQSTWVFRSKTIRMKPSKITCTGRYENIFNNNNNRRAKKLQYLSPFYSSESRFRNWYNWIPVYGSVGTPDPAYYCTAKPSFTPIIFTGTFSRQRRFAVPVGSETPAPNQYVLGGFEKHIVFNTHNFILKKNIKKRQKKVS